MLSGDGDLSSDQEEDCLKRDLRSLLGQLPHLQEQVLRMRYGGWGRSDEPYGYRPDSGHELRPCSQPRA